MRRACLAGALLLVASATLAQLPDEQHDIFDELATRIQQNTGTTSEADVIRMLDLGEKLGRNFAAGLALKGYIRRQTEPSQRLLRYAIDNAIRSSDFQAAVTRCKAYLKNAQPGAETSAVVAMLLTLQIDYLRAYDDAYRFIGGQGRKYRQNVRVRKYDVWFLGQAHTRSDIAGTASQLATIFAEKLPLEMERHYYWDDLDSLMSKLKRKGAAQYAATAAARRLVSLIRNDRRRTALYGFYVENIAFHAASTGKEQEKLKGEFSLVTRAAMAAFDVAPTTRTLGAICDVFTDGDPNRGFRDYLAPQKREFFTAAFAKLAAAEQKKMLAWKWPGWNALIPQYLATPEQWTALATRFPNTFRGTPDTSRTLISTSKDPQTYRQQSPLVAGVATREAAIINSLAAGNTLDAIVDHLVQKESWHLDRADVYKLLWKEIWPRFNSYPRDEQNKLSGDYLGKAVSRFGQRYVATSPLALDADTARAFITSAWRNSGTHPDDKSQVAKQLAVLNWVPFTAEQRKNVFGSAHGEFKTWSEKVRKQSAEATARLKTRQKAFGESRQQLGALKQEQEATRQALVQQTQAKAAADPADAAKVQQIDQQLKALQAKTTDLAAKVAEKEKTVTAQQAALQIDTKLVTDTKAWMANFSAIEQAFRSAMALAPANRAQGPNPLCEQMARLHLARSSGNRDAFVAAAREVVRLTAAYDQQKIPTGWSSLKDALTSPKNMDIADLQCEVLTRELQAWQPAGENKRIHRIAGMIAKSGQGWNWGAIPAKDRAQSVKLNTVYAKAVTAQFDKGHFAQPYFQWMLWTRYGSGWNDYSLNTNIVERMIKEKTLVAATGYRPAGATAASAYMWLLRHYFADLNKTYPYQTYFDDMYVEEVTRTGIADTGYWTQSGSDRQYKVRNAVATLLQKYETPPIGYGDAPAVYSRSTFSSLSSRASGASPAVRDAMLAKFESQYGTSRFDSYAMGLTYFSAQAKPGEKAQRPVYFEKLGRFIDRAKAIPAVRPRVTMYPLYSIRNSLTLDEVRAVTRLFTPDASPDSWPGGWYYEHIVPVLVAALYPKSKSPDPVLFTAGAEFWRVARDVNNAPLQKELLAVGQRLMNDGHYDLAVAWAKSGLGVGGRSFPGELRGALGVLQSRALSNIKGVIPVKRADERYPLFAAQANYNGGNLQGAWAMYLEGQEVLMDHFRELDPIFTTWLIDRNVELENFDRAEMLARAMIQDMDSNTLRLPPYVRVRVLLSYANIAFHLPEFPRARALYERIATAREFDGLEGQIAAELRIAEIDRIQKDFDGAIQRIEKVLERKTPYALVEGHYHMALVLRDQEQLEDALNQLNEVFAVDSLHVEAILEEGRIKLKLQRLEEVTDLDLGISQKQKFLVPGKVLKVRVIDKQLRIVKRTTAIEIKIRADSGDEEVFTLVPWADSLTRFEGEIKTSLAAPNPGDNTLQVIGSDLIHYDFSDRFKQKHNVQSTDEAEHTLRVISDSELYASSGEILTGKDLEEQQELERIRREFIEQGRRIKPEASLLSERRPGTQVKPGNPINVRVEDDDRSTTAGKDEVVISVSASSGDSIGALALVETNTHAGVFDGVIPTESAPATAFATDSDEGTEPNYPISGGDYPAWVALPDNKRPKVYGVDLNDSVFLATMRIDAGIPGRKLKEFFLQTSLNGRDYEIAGSWPTPYKPWGGSPRGVLVRIGSKLMMPSASIGIKDLDTRIAGTRYAGRRGIRLETLKASWDTSIFGHADALRINWDPNHEETWYLARFSAAFYTPTRQHRTFTLKAHNGGEHLASFLLTLDGQPGIPDSGDDAQDTTPLQYKGVLKKGVHRINVYVIAPRRSVPSFEVYADIEEPPYLEPCPAAMFDIEQHPEIRQWVYKEPAKIVPNEDASSFDVTFGENTRARVFRLVIFDFETDAPAISKIQLDGIGRPRVLPTEMDLMALRHNNVLEIIPGDRIKVTYEDPRHIGPNSRLRDVFLSATFANAAISPNMVVGYKLASDGRRMPVRFLMRRYKAGDSIDVLVNDPDGDVSPKRDEIEISVHTTEGVSAKLKAIESGPNTGAFEVRIFPVEEEPQRATDILVRESDDIIMEYLDSENTDPGIPWTRVAIVEQVWYQEPELRSYSVTSMPIEVKQEETEEEDFSDTAIDEYYPVTHRMVATRPNTADPPDEPQTFVIGGPLVVELLWPTIAQTVASKADIYAQTSSGRARMPAADSPVPYDINVPGTIHVIGSYGTPGGSVSPPRGYESVFIVGTRHAGIPIDDGRFMFRIPVRLGKLPDETLAIPRDDDPLGRTIENVLNIKAGDTIHLGFRYTNDVDEVVWITRDYKLAADAFFDVMNRTYQKPVRGVYVDESVYLRARDGMMDVSDQRDDVTVALRTSSGFTNTLTLTETTSHSAIFKSLIRFVYAEEGKLIGDYQPGEMPVRFGDSVLITCDPGEGRAAIAHTIEVFKGSNGDLVPFTKRFTDPEMAVKTQLSIAEAYFEMAKKHRKLKRKELTRKEIALGKKVLEEALRDYPDSEAQAQGDYLIANLALELAEETEGEEQRDYYNEALLKFTKLVSQHRESSYAPKAQFKKALTLEKMGDFDTACEEYVKLSYRWPDNELIAETIARLGKYFFDKGKLLLDIESTDPVEIELAKQRAHRMFTAAAEVFGRLSVRFPNHKLAEKTLVLSGQCYMRADRYFDAVDTLRKVIDKKDADKDVRAEAMYWCGDSYTKMKHTRSGKTPPLVMAYRMFKKLTWDYPSTIWAKYARARLTESQIAGAGEDNQ